MSGNMTGNTSAIRRAQVYSQVILDEIKDGFLPEGMHRDVSDFGDGDTLNITTFGEVVLRDLTEGQDTPIDAVDTGSITLSITEHVGAGAALTDKVKQDSWQAAQFEAMLVPKMLRAIQERYESDLLSQQSKQTSGNANAVNGVAHRFCASGTDRTLAIDDIIYAKLAMDRANLPDEGRIAIVSPAVEATLNSLTGISDTIYNPRFEGMIETGFAKNMKFIKNIYGIDFFVTNRLPTLTAQETLDTSGIAIPAPASNDNGEIGDTVCQFWCVADDMTTPIMGAWRQMPEVEGDRNVAKRQDEFYATARWGFGLQRPQSIISLVTNSSAY